MTREWKKNKKKKTTALKQIDNELAVDEKSMAAYEAQKAHQTYSTRRKLYNAEKTMITLDNKNTVLKLI